MGQTAKTGRNRKMKAAVASFIIAALIIVVLIGAGARAASHWVSMTVGSLNGGSDDSPMTTVTETPDAFHALVVDGSIDVDLKQGSRTSLKLEGQGDAIGRIHRTVKDGVLHIWLTGNSNFGRTPRATLSTPTFDSLQVDGSGDVSLQALDTNSLSVSINGSSDVKAAGKCATLDVSISGSGDFGATNLAAENVTASVDGSGDVHVNAAKSLKVAISGSGDVDYVGRPQVTQSISGSGDVNHQE